VRHKRAVSKEIVLVTIAYGDDKQGQELCSCVCGEISLVVVSPCSPSCLTFFFCARPSPKRVLLSTQDGGQVARDGEPNFNFREKRKRRVRQRGTGLIDRDQPSLWQPRPSWRAQEAKNTGDRALVSCSLARLVKYSYAMRRARVSRTMLLVAFGFSLL